MNDLTWVEIDEKALISNIQTLRKLVGADRVLCPCIKANAYGHGIELCGRIFLKAGADWLGVNSIYEARKLRESGINCPIYVLGYIGLEQIAEAFDLDLSIVCYNRETILKISEEAQNHPGLKAPRIHLKVETGNNRQGIRLEELLDFANFAREKGVEIEGLTTHFANIEDTTDHSYAMEQFGRFREAIDLLENIGFKIPFRHCANSAASILFDEVRLNMVRPGIVCYGMWPSRETYLSSRNTQNEEVELRPALCWKARVAQVKFVPANEFVGYGLTYKTSRDTKLAIIPVGYYDGYDRGLNQAYVLIRGKRAPVRGRICMNIIMADISDIPEACIEDEVVLIGKQKNEFISAETFATWASTINYEVTTRINERIPRILV